MSEEVEKTTAEFWKDRWNDGNTKWHRDKVNAILIKYVDELTGGRSNMRVFIPLCGKSIDMLWLADQGHTVVGVELAKQAIESFFTENSLTFTVESVKMAAASEPADVYNCNEKKITIFCCDLFNLTEADLPGKMDAIWDRASFVAIALSVGDRGKRYTKKMHSLLACDGSYMLESLYYEVDRGDRPPASMSDELRNEVFGEDFTIRELEVIRQGEEPGLPFAADFYYHVFKPKN